MDLKLGTIRAIRNSGLEVQHVIHRHGMDEETATEVEAALSDAYPGLTNLVRGSAGDRGIMHVDEILQKYEAQPSVFQHNVVLIDVGRTSEDRNLYDAVRCMETSWKKGMQAEYALAVRKGLIIGVFVPERWLPATPENFPGMPETGPDRWAFEGRAAPDEIITGCTSKSVPPKRKRGERWATRYQPAEVRDVAPSAR